MSVMYKSATMALLRAISSTPSRLKEQHPDMVAFLNAQGNPEAQGTGNKATDQEGAFAKLAQTHGFRFWPKGTPPPAEDGLYMCYQIQGTQKSGDFSLRKVIGGAVRADIVVDLKHTTSKSFYLNDGWFEDNVYYVISWNEGTKGKPLQRAHIALGQDIPTEEERVFMRQLQAFKAQTNKDNKVVGSLRPYVRFANQYSCATFTREKESDCLLRVLANVDVVATEGGDEAATA